MLENLTKILRPRKKGNISLLHKDLGRFSSGLFGISEETFFSVFTELEESNICV